MSHEEGKPPVAVSISGTQAPIPTKLGGSLREMAFQWLFSQGATTVLLTIIVVGAPYVVLPRIQQGYETQAQYLQMTTKMIVDSHDRDRQAFERAIDMMSRRP